VPRLQLPTLDPRHYFSGAEIVRAHEYRRVTRILLVCSLVLELVVLGLFAWKGRMLADALAGLGRGRIRTGLLLALAASLGVWLAGLPLAVVAQWWSRRYGLSNQGYGPWLRDQALAFLVQTLLVGIAVAGAMVLAGRLGGSWWLAGGPALALVGVLFAVVQPLVVAPLFNRFHPVSDRTLAVEIERLARREGVPVEEVLVADASRRTTAANAYVSGLGPTRRIVLYDTMLDGRFTRGEIVAAVAHELGHVKRKHLWKGVAWFALIAIPATWLVAAATARRGGAGEPAAVALGLLVAFALFLATLPLSNVFSRRYEAEADWLALESTHDPRSVVGVEQKLVTTSLGDPSPPGWVQLFFGTHPTAMQRIGMASAFRIRARAGS
jgi:STE24 endopeptidase